MGLTRWEYLKKLEGASLELQDLSWLLDPVGLTCLEELARASRTLTRQRFGNTISLYAPLYLSNDCVNQCLYCGFNVRNQFPRRQLTHEEIATEAQALAQEGFTHILLLSGESPRSLPVPALAEAVRLVKEIVPQVSVEIYPLSQSGYEKLVEAGCDGVTLYQETYDKETYARVHAGGPKRHFQTRYDTPLLAAKAGMRSVGLGFLMGLAPFPQEVQALAQHAKEVVAADWRVRLAFSFPRLRPHVGGYEPPFPVSDQELAQMVFVLRLLFPDAELVLSTRESREMRDGLIPLGITRISAGSSTEPGGYTAPQGYGEQFEIHDGRTPSEIAAYLVSQGLEPLWKDWDWACNEKGPHATT